MGLKKLVHRLLARRRSAPSAACDEGDGADSIACIAVHQDADNILDIEFVVPASAERAGKAAARRQDAASQSLARLYHGGPVILSEIPATEPIRAVIRDDNITELCEYVAARGALAESEARTLFAQLVRTVNYLHQNRILVSMLQRSTTLVDGPRRRLHFVGFATGPIAHRAYAAPMPLRRAFSDVLPETGPPAAPLDYATDVWCLGVVLYYMLCGAPPFSRDCCQCAQMSILEGAPPVPESVGPAAKELLAQVLHPDAARRASIAAILAHPWLADERSPPTDTVEHTPILCVHRPIATQV
ncbi:hypothetical protein IWQ57_000415 [Coemansia nantahalensis]|uniref:Uncharacterized protein n=1 Tax=Coemansia nantahalensis TaxID=2789366 RepID=A0ACC1K877_9FUNG|nr:hypothetical protein IWQ57_000415 [Coemansia nantahalensis]